MVGNLTSSTSKSLIFVSYLYYYYYYYYYFYHNYYFYHHYSESYSCTSIRPHH